MTILKVQLKDEIRRITVDKSALNMVDLETKVRNMFPQLSIFVMQFTDDEGTLVDLLTEEDLALCVAKAEFKNPPILKLYVAEGRTRPVVTAPPVSDSSDEVENLPVSSGFVCTSCGAVIDGDVTYKCINCIDVVLCESCEAKVEHDVHHLMVKLRVPLDSLPLKQQMIFTEHILNSEEKNAASQKRKELRNQLKNKDLEMKFKTKAERIKARKERIRRRLEAKKKLDEQAKRTSRKSSKKSKKSSKKSSAANNNVVAQLAEPIPQPAVEEVVFPEPVVDSPVMPRVEVIEPVVTEVFIPETIESHVIASAVPPASAVEEEADVVVVERTSEEEEVVDQQPEQPVSDEKESSESEEEWNLIDGGLKVLSDLGDGISSTVNSVASALAPSSPEDLRIQGIAFRQKLDALESMGFTDRNRNILLLVKHLANLEATVSDLVSS